MASFGASGPPYVARKLNTWHGWGHDSTRSGGVIKIGKDSYKGSVVLSKLRSCGTQRHYLRATFKFKSRPRYNYAFDYTCDGFIDIG